MKLKYIVIEYDGVEIPIVFPLVLQHADVAGAMIVKSAGFCQFDVRGQWSTFGGSTSLNINARPDDAIILNKYMPKQLQTASLME